MSEIIPAINAENFEEVRRRIKLVEPFVKWVHLDVADGTFTSNAIWHQPADLLTLETQLLVEVHLMISDMDFRWRDWVLPRVNRVIFHEEAAHDPEFVLNKVKEARKEVGVAIRPETDWKKLEPFCEKADLVQTLAVPPGRAGQEFRLETLDKIRHLRKIHPKCIIEIDGGINPETGKKCVSAGANILVSANYIFNSEDISKTIEDLKHVSSARR